MTSKLIKRPLAVVSQAAARLSGMGGAVGSRTMMANSGGLSVAGTEVRVILSGYG